mmetsp:Transcript_109165/g.305214  ORF Transcript_109165/g.305214 Transcript_109165/m.305214 type:complete len:285 (+) Transcript_109165:485-1339(+)
MALRSLCDSRTPCLWTPLNTPQMMWWKTSSLSTLSCGRFRITGPSPPCSDPSAMFAMSNVPSASHAKGGILTWKPGGGEGLLSWPGMRPCRSPLGAGLQSKLRDCSLGLPRSSRRSRCAHDEQDRATWQRCTPGCTQPGSCWSASLGPSWRSVPSLLISASGAAPIGTDAVRAASWRCTAKDGSQTAEPWRGSLEEKMSSSTDSTSACTSETRTSVLSHLRKAPSRRATSRALHLCGPSHCTISVRTSASEVMGRSSCERIASTKATGSSCHLSSSAIRHMFRL